MARRSKKAENSGMVQAHFVVTGEALTRIARDLMLSDEPGQAYRLLAEGLIGDEAQSVALRVLRGEVNLNGDSDIGIGTEDATVASVAKYLRDLRYIYGGRVKLKGRWYRPVGPVTSYGPDDARAASKMEAAEFGVSIRMFARKRAEYYAPPGGFVELVKHDTYPEHVYMVFEPCGESPHWLHPARDAQAAVDHAVESGRSLREMGWLASQPSTIPRPPALVRLMVDEEDLEIEKHEEEELLELAYAAEDELRIAHCQEIGAAVRERAGDDVFDMTLNDGRVVKVPRAPFMHWALSRVDEFKTALPAWTPVAPCGMKMCNDDPYHTDWMLGAGLVLEESYDENVTGPAWQVAFDMQMEAVEHAG